MKRPLKFSIITAIFLTITCWVSPVVAEDDVKGFFSKDFVRGGDYTSTIAPGNPDTPSKTSSTGPTGTLFDVNSKDKKKQRSVNTPPKTKTSAAKKRASSEEKTEKSEITTTPPSHDEVMKHSSDIISRVKAFSQSSASAQNSQKLQQMKKQASSQKNAASQRGENADTAAKNVKMHFSKQQSTAVLSLVVAAEPKGHMVEQIRQLANIHQRYKIPVGEVLVVYPDLSPMKFLRSGLFDKDNIESLEVLQKNGVGLKPVTSVPSRLGARKSPVWVVRYKGKDHVFEGHQSPFNFFSPHGEFLEDAIPEAKKGKAGSQSGK